MKTPLGGQRTSRSGEAWGHFSSPVLGLYGDAGIPRGLRKALADASEAHPGSPGTLGNPSAKASKNEVFAEAEHGFHADYRPSYHPAAAEAGWQQLQDWFKANGVAPVAPAASPASPATTPAPVAPAG